MKRLKVKVQPLSYKWGWEILVHFTEAEAKREGLRNPEGGGWWNAWMIAGAPVRGDFPPYNREWRGEERTQEKPVKAARSALRELAGFLAVDEFDKQRTIAQGLEVEIK